jgi:predicted hotdog family 3-hydroxylacyl-ACP dehydratase
MNKHPNITDLIPHSGKMVLLDAIDDYGENWLQATVNISNQSTFYKDGGVSSVYALEYMAQTIAAFAGIKNAEQRKAKKIGFITGCRKFNVETEKFVTGQKLLVRAEEYFNDGKILAFDCWIKDGKLLASARINVYVQDN